MFRDYKKYEVFEDGRVYSYASKRFLKPAKNKRNGYNYLHLTDNEGDVKNYRVHRVVYEAVRGNIPEGMQVNHIDEDKSNNSISNLNLMTPKENINWGSGNERRAEKLRGKPNPKVAEKLTNGVASKQVAAYKDGSLAMVFPSTQEAERQGYHHSHISQCCNGLRKTHGGYQWLYFEDSPPLFYIAA